MTHFIHLHGFCSTPMGNKTRFLRESFTHCGHELITPDLNQPDFFELTITRQIEAVGNVTANLQGEINLMGSSMGALVALHYAEKWGGIDRLVVLAPALDLTQGFVRQLSQPFIDQWRELGSAEFLHFGYDRMEPVSYRLYEDLLLYRKIELTRPIQTLILQGTRDETCPVEAAIQFAEQRSHVRLVLLDTDHMMHNQLDRIWDEIRDFLEI